MFTGIVQGKATVTHMDSKADHLRLDLLFPPSALDKVTKGASIAVNGTCLTVVHFDTEKATARFDVIRETLDKTNLSALQINDKVNFERAARIGDEIGGHLMSGHISTSVEVIAINKTSETCDIDFETPNALQHYLLPKGFVGLNGCSLTLGEVNSDTFTVHLIPETLEVTTFGQLKQGDRVNLEIDSQTQAIVDTVSRYMAEQGGRW